ncbi:hypothetical protein CcCBS67573_g09264 [Chytriomyces confervae]|uniref:CxC2-like cysteine cluster KDZ transposase-associated domain-containing protein n=1 Tax=Chytriomyces confervae TaxID=246404 RepID=A0A507DZV7_9FUNG|nr:hypothetical protein CcCBS67573_g09264 [Chytriomyces confervae]
MRRDPHPSDHVPPAPPVRGQQSQPQRTEPADNPEQADDTFQYDNAFPNETIDNPLETDTDTGITSMNGRSLWTFDNHKAGMLAEYSKLVTANLTGCACSVDDQPFQCNARWLDCCEMSPLHSEHVVQLSTQDCSEQVICHICSSHSVLMLLMSHGFMVNKAAKPDHAFSIPIVHVALKACIHGTSYESCTGIFFSDSSKSARNKGLYQPFMDAVRFFSGLSQAVQHGTIHAPDTVGWGKTVCPMCEGNGDGEYPLVLKQMDGFESARKRAVEYGGGHNHGHYSWARQFWYKPGEDHVTRAREEERIIAKKQSQQSQYDRIVHQGCMHDFFERIFNAKGERLLYCDTVIEMLREQYPNRELALSYDVMCKEVAHLQQPYMRQTKIEMLYITVLPVMHAQAHSKECQVKFSPRIIAGLGTKLDEGNWELDISLIAEDYNCSKLQSALKIISYKLDLAYVDLVLIEGAIGEPSDLNRGSYRGFIDKNNTW